MSRPVRKGSTPLSFKQRALPLDHYSIMMGPIPFREANALLEVINVTRCASYLSHKASELEWRYSQGSGRPERRRMHQHFAEQTIPQMPGITRPEAFQAGAIHQLAEDGID